MDIFFFQLVIIFIPGIIWERVDAQQREVRLRDVIAYDFEGKVLFEAPRVYLARKADSIDIEFPYRPPAGATE